MIDIPISVLQLLHDGWGLRLKEDQQRGYYAEIERWAWSKTGSRRRREWAGGLGTSPGRAIEDAVKRIRPQHMESL